MRGWLLKAGKTAGVRRECHRSEAYSQCTTRSPAGGGTGRGKKKGSKKRRRRFFVLGSRRLAWFPVTQRRCKESGLEYKIVTH